MRLDLVSQSQKKGCEYKFYTEFQSHEPEFDYLKSLEIEEKINKIKWCRRQNSAHFLLSTNGESWWIPMPRLHPQPLQTRPSSYGRYSRSHFASYPSRISSTDNVLLRHLHTDPC